MVEDLKYKEITEKMIGCAMAVHRKMKSGYVEAVYQKCLAIELTKAGLNFVQEVEVPIFYDEIMVGKRRVDFMINNTIIVEIKAVTELTDQPLAQALNYLETHKLETGLLINFGSRSLQFKRLLHQSRGQQKSNPINPTNL